MTNANKESPERWRKASRIKPEPGRCVIVWEAEDRNHYMAWWDGKRWWAWSPVDADPNDNQHLPFKPSHWCYPPPPPTPAAPPEAIADARADRGPR